MEMRGVIAIIEMRKERRKIKADISIPGDSSTQRNLTNRQNVEKKWPIIIGKRSQRLTPNPALIQGSDFLIFF